MKSITGKKSSVISKRFHSMLLASVMTTMTVYILMLSDSIVAGQMINPAAVSAVTLLSPVTAFITFMSYLIASGASLLSSVEAGKGDRKSVNRTFAHGFWLVVVIGCILTALLFTVARTGIEYWNVSAVIFEQMIRYFKGMRFLPIAMGINLFFYSFYLEEGREQTCFNVALLETVLNIILSVTLAKRMGAMGVSAATTVSMVVGAVIFAFLLPKMHIYLFRKESYEKFFDLSILKNIFIVGINDSMDSLLMVMLPAIISSYLIFRFGDDHIIIFTVVLNILNMVGAFMGGLTTCMESMVCQYYGEDNYNGVREIMKTAVKTAVIFSVVMAVILIVFAEIVPLIFGIRNPIRINETATAMRIFVVFIVFYCVEFNFYEYYGCVDQVRLSMTFIAMLVLVMPVAGVILGGELFGINGTWAGMGVGYFLCMLINMITEKIMAKRSSKRYHGRLFIEEEGLKAQMYYDIEGTEENIAMITEKAGEDMAARGIDSKKSIKVQLLMEEMGMEALKRQEGKPFRIEYTIIPGDKLKLIVRDNGVMVNITKDAERLTNASFRSYVIAQAASRSSSRYRPAGEKNRTIFTIE